MLTIAGSQVNLHDRAYSLRAGAFGTFIAVNENSAILRVTLESGYRDFVVGPNGIVANRVDCMWHAPLALSLPKGSEAKLAKIQAICDAANGVL